MSTVGSSRQVPSAPRRGTSSSRSRKSLSVSSRYNGCPPVCANRKSPRAESFVSGAGDAPDAEGRAVACSRLSPPLFVLCAPSPAMACTSWRVSAWLSACNDTWLTGRSRPRAERSAASCDLGSSSSLRTVPSSSTPLPCFIHECPPQRLHQGLIGQASIHFESVPAQHLG